MLPSVDELLALDVLTLRAHTEQAGVIFDIDEHRLNLKNSLSVNEVCSVRRDSTLVAYAMLRPDAGTRWFVGALGTHPSYRTYGVISELLAKIAALASEHEIGELRSHVYRTNQLSVAFHRRLGFHVTHENDKGFEFVITVDELNVNPAVRRAAAIASRFK